jgi:hypothetical protein
MTKEELDNLEPAPYEEKHRFVLKIYLSGPMSGLTSEQYKKNFKEAEEIVRKVYKETNRNPKLAIVNASIDGLNEEEPFDYEDRMHVDFACIDICDVIVLLPNWKNGKRSLRELYHGLANKKTIYYIDGVALAPFFEDEPSI